MMKKEMFWIEKGEIVYYGHPMSRKQLLKFLVEFDRRLKEKDEKIEYYQKSISDICSQFMVCSLKELPKAIAHQVCEKIKNEIMKSGLLKD